MLVYFNETVNNIAQILTEAARSPFGCRLLALFMCLSAPWTASETANAQQVYVAGESIGLLPSIGVCNASLEGAFSGNFIRTGIGPLVITGNTLFVGENNVVASYNASTGATLNGEFIVAHGFSGISALATSGNTLFVAYVGNLGGNFIGTYDATTGAAINAKLILLPGQPASIALSGNTLFVDMFNTIWSYNGVDGAVIKANLVTGLSSAIAVSGNTLFVANANGTIATYIANTGIETNATFIIASPLALAISGNTLFVEEQHVLSTYDSATGARIASITQSQFYFSKLAVGGASANPNVLNFGTVAPNWRIETVGNFSTTGNIDLVFVNTNGSGASSFLGDPRAIWYLGDGGLSGANSIFPAGLHVPGPPWRIAGAGDFNGDASTDLVWENTSTGQHAIWLLQGSHLENPLNLPTINPQWRIAGAADFNKDGSADLVWENTATGQRAIWLLSNGVLSSTINLPTVGTRWHIAGTGDFAGDGNADLVWENTETGEHAIWFLKNGVFSSSISLPTLSTNWRIAGVGDFNGDGQADLVWQNTITGQIIVWLLKDGVLLDQ
jgi:hypothetical protein